MARASNIDFLIPFVVDPAILDWDEARSSGTDLTRRVIDLFGQIQDDPSAIGPKTLRKKVRDLVFHDESQIGRKLQRLTHFFHVGSINRQLTTALSALHPELDLPTPQAAYTSGVVHDISTVYCRRGGKFLGFEKELPLLHHARHLGVPDLADAAVHNAYPDVLNMIRDREGFAQAEMYAAWQEALQEEGGLHNYDRIMLEYADLLEGKGKAGLITLTLADCLDVTSGGKTIIDLDDLQTPFEIRLGDIQRRNYDAKIEAGDTPTPHGIALAERGGRERIEGYLAMVDDLLHGRNLELYNKDVHPGLWK